MKTIVYFADGSIEETAWADIYIAKGLARLATNAERLSYERQFLEDDERMN